MQEIVIWDELNVNNYTVRYDEKSLCAGRYDMSRLSDMPISTMEGRKMRKPWL